jgi:hypothetical protein
VRTDESSGNVTQTVPVAASKYQPSDVPLKADAETRGTGRPSRVTPGGAEAWPLTLRTYVREQSCPAYGYFAVI